MYSVSSGMKPSGSPTGGILTSVRQKVLWQTRQETDELMREIYEESFMIDEKHRYRFLTTGQPAEVTADSGLLKYLFVR